MTDRPEDLGPGADHHAVAQRRMALALVPGGAAERHAVIQGDVVADLGGLADHDAGAVVDEEAPADARAGMNVDIGQRARQEGQQARHDSASRTATGDGPGGG